MYCPLNKDKLITGRSLMHFPHDITLWYVTNKMMSCLLSVCFEFICLFLQYLILQACLTLKSAAYVFKKNIILSIFFKLFLISLKSQKETWCYYEFTWKKTITGYVPLKYNIVQGFQGFWEKSSNNLPNFGWVNGKLKK